MSEIKAYPFTFKGYAFFICKLLYAKKLKDGKADEDAAGKE